MTRILSMLFAFAVFLPAIAGAQAPASPGDARRGGAKVQMCIGCHGIVGYQADFPQVYKVPMIAGQDARYLVAALTQYRSGDRHHPTMRSVAASLTDTDIADVAAYYAGLGQPAGPVPAAAALPAALQTKLATCIACHGANFSAPTDPSIPRLAGQHADYLLYALRAYQVEGNPHFGRSNASMNAMAKALSADDIDQITGYLASLPGQLRTVAQAKFK